jgi:hypothetical protein
MSQQELQGRQCAAISHTAHQMPTLLPRDPSGRGPAIARARHRTALHPTVQGDNRELSALGIREGGRTSSTAAATAVLSFVLVRRALSRTMLSQASGFAVAAAEV